jgi:hypothetical protein
MKPDRYEYKEIIKPLLGSRLLSSCRWISLRKHSEIKYHPPHPHNEKKQFNPVKPYGVRLHWIEFVACRGLHHERLR